MKKIILLFAFSVVVFSACKKTDTPEPARTITNTVTIRDTVKIINNVIQKDTVYCMLKSELVHGTWYAYKDFNTLITPIPIIFYSNYFSADGSNSGTGVYYTPDFSAVMGPSGIIYSVSVVNCTELLLTSPTSKITLKR
jgi:hypothetical protein